MMKYNYRDWKNVFNMTDEEFCKTIGCSVDELYDLTPIHNKEIDIQISGLFTGIRKEFWKSVFTNPLL